MKKVSIIIVLVTGILALSGCAYVAPDIDSALTERRIEALLQEQNALLERQNVLLELLLESME